jgi:Ca2+-binding RTX toxin-like protein
VRGLVAAVVATGVLACGGVALAETVRGTARGDTLIGSPQSDVIKGLAGDDALYGGPGVDRLDGGRGRDHIWGGDGDDVIVGGPLGDLAGSTPLRRHERIFGGAGHADDDDSISCVGRRDRVVIDQYDVAGPECEVVRRVAR